VLQDKRVSHTTHKIRKYRKKKSEIKIFLRLRTKYGTLTVDRQTTSRNNASSQMNTESYGCDEKNI